MVCPHERYVPSLTKLYGLEGRKPKPTPDIGVEDQNTPELGAEGKSKFRSALGTLLYIAQDRVDIQCTVGGLSQYMTCPTKWAESSLRHLILYLMGTMDYGILLPYPQGQNSKLDEVYGKEVADEEEFRLEIWSDSDWAGDKSTTRTRRHSVSSVLIFLNKSLVCSWSRTQKTISLSSCEAEFMACIGGCAEGLHLAGVWRFLTRKEVEVVAVTDSSSCRSFTQRQGVGKMKHLDAKMLWLQEETKRGSLQVVGVPTLLNAAALGTKRLSKARRLFLQFNRFSLVWWPWMNSQETSRTLAWKNSMTMCRRKHWQAI